MRVFFLLVEGVKAVSGLRLVTTFGCGHHSFDALLPVGTRFVNETAGGGGTWDKFSVV